MYIFKSKLVFYFQALISALDVNKSNERSFLLNDIIDSNKTTILHSRARPLAFLYPALLNIQMVFMGENQPNATAAAQETAQETAPVTPAAAVTETKTAAATEAETTAKTDSNLIENKSSNRNHIKSIKERAGCTQTEKESIELSNSSCYTFESVDSDNNSSYYNSNAGNFVRSVNDSNEDYYHNHNYGNQKGDDKEQLNVSKITC